MVFHATGSRLFLPIEWDFVPVQLKTASRTSVCAPQLSNCPAVMRERRKGQVEGTTEVLVIRAELSVRIVPRHHKRTKLIRMAFNTAGLLSVNYKQEFKSNLDDKFEGIGPPTGGSEGKWNQFKEVVTDTAKTVLGPKAKLDQDRFDYNNKVLRTLLDDKRKPYTDWQNHPNCPSWRNKYGDCHTRAKRELRGIQDR